ncbi:MAG: hypothetical protein FD124_3757, partial [Alphaproteobacteria bacterium]
MVCSCWVRQLKYLQGLEQYLAEQQLTDQTLTVLPLTGDASDRRYFRVLLKNARPIVLALHAGAIDYD